MGTWEILSFFLLVLTVSAQLRYGRKTKENEFPFAVCIIGDIRIQGTLVTLDKLITSAQNLVQGLSNVGKLSVVAGVVSTVDVKNKNYQLRRLIYFKPYYDFHWDKTLGIMHDIALAGVNMPFFRSAAVNVAPIISGEADVFKSTWEELINNKTLCQVVSWGSVKGSEPYLFARFITTMRSFDVTPMRDDDCNKSLVNFYTPDFTCAISRNASSYIVSTSGFGGTLVCKGNVYAIYYRNRLSIKNRIHIFTLIWHYLDYFNLGELRMNLTSSSSRHLLSFQLFIFTACYLLQKS